MKIKYPKDMDFDCIELCNVLNSLKGIKTVESCCGHLKDVYMIIFKCNNFYSLSILARTFDSRYSNGKWKLQIETDDNIQKPFATFYISLYRTEVFKSQKEMDEELKIIIEHIQYWSQKKFKKHLKGRKEM